MKKLRIQKHTRTDFLTYLGVIAAFAVLSTLNTSGGLSRSLSGQLVPICCYMSMAVSLNLTVGILGELSLGHAGFMSVGAFSGIIAAMSLQSAIPSEPIRLAIAMVVGALVAALAGVIVGTPVLRLRGDYLAIVTLAFGEIIKELVNCLLVGHDSRGLHIALNITGSKSIADLHLEEDGLAIIKGAQGAAGTNTIATFTAGFLLVMVTLAVVLNLKHSRAGRAVMALRDNSIAAESIGLNITKYKMMAFVTSAALAGAAGALYGLNFSSLQATKFNFNTSILILVFVVLGGLGNIWGSLIAAAALTVLPEMLRAFSDYRMLVYAIVLILVMLATNNPTFKVFFSRFRRGGSRKSTGKEAM
ncbi:MAG: branched-chain amino acid ABC transporter permease [Oscillospiraceae bacterium]|uniref:branched-chain amino acid ABC transporter permease n=1 Tax=Pusillibacter faecalis TaxID=2714358 RepID=UPI00294394EE|nr:branched-chain amino acid ABC transporter permease [Pusillibacter faecalis]